MSSELSKAFQARLKHAEDSDEQHKPKPAVSKKPLPPPKNINSKVANKINASLAHKGEKPHPLTAKPKPCAKPKASVEHHTTNGTKPTAGVVALASVLQGNTPNKTGVETNGSQHKANNGSTSRLSPKLSRLDKTKSVEITKLRSVSDVTARPFNSVDHDDEFFKDSGRQRSSPVVTPSSSPSLAHRKRRTMTSSTSDSFDSPLASPVKNTSTHHSSESNGQSTEITRVADRFERSTSLPRDSSLPTSPPANSSSQKPALNSQYSSGSLAPLSTQNDNVKARSASDLRKLGVNGNKKRPPPPPKKPPVPGSKPHVQPKPFGSRPAPPPKPPTINSLKGTQFSRPRSTSPSSQETPPDTKTRSSSFTPLSRKESLGDDSLEETLKASSSSHDSENLDKTLTGDNQSSSDWVLVDGDSVKGRTGSPGQLSPTPAGTKKPLSPPTRRKTHSPDSNKCKTPTPPTLLPKPGKESPTHSTHIKPSPPGGSPQVDNTSSSSSSSSPSILISTSSMSEPKTWRGAKTDSGFGSEAPDDLSPVAGTSVESLPSDNKIVTSPPPPQVTKGDNCLLEVTSPPPSQVTKGDNCPSEVTSPPPPQVTEEEWDTARLEKARSKRHHIAGELLSTEKTYVDRIKLIAVEFHDLVTEFNVKNKQVIPVSDVQQIFLNIQQIYQLNENILQELQKRMDSWSTQEGLGDVLARLAPFLKLYTTYTSGFEDAMQTLTEWTKRDRKFDTLIREFERNTLSTGLGVAPYMLEPVQRIPRYKLLLTDYLKYLPPDSPDRPDTTKALGIIAEAADRTNNRIKEIENSNEILAIHRSLTDYEGSLLAPSRVFIQKGELYKSSRKTETPRMFFLFSDVLLHTQPSGNGVYKFRNEMPILGMTVEEPKVAVVPFSFNVKSTTRALILVASSEEEKQDWMVALNKVISDDLKKRSSLRRDLFISTDSCNDSFGMQAPIMVPDKSVTMCQACSAAFSFTFRRHHCRACGKVVCGNCSQWKTYLTYMDKTERVCEQCHNKAKGVTSETDGAEPSPKLPKKQESTASGVLNLKALEDDAVIAAYVLSHDGRNWKKLWYQVKKDFVLYKFKAHEDIKAIHSMPLPGYLVTPDRGSSVINLIHPSSKKHLCDSFKVEDPVAFESWVTVLGKVVNMDLPEHTLISPTSNRSSLVDSFDLPSRPLSSVHSGEDVTSSGSRPGSFSSPKHEDSSEHKESISGSVSPVES